LCDSLSLWLGQLAVSMIYSLNVYCWCPIEWHDVDIGDMCPIEWHDVDIGDMCPIEWHDVDIGDMCPIEWHDISYYILWDCWLGPFCKQVLCNRNDIT
jgi:hypothetical protein